MGKEQFKVLLVENSRTTAMHLMKVLGTAGFDAAFVRDGVEAVEKIKTELFDLVLMDLYMPSLNGYEAATLIRQLPAPSCDTPIVAVTASTEERDKEICQKAGMNDFFLKSEGEAALIALVERYRKNE